MFSNRELWNLLTNLQKQLTAKRSWRCRMISCQNEVFGRYRVNPKINPVLRVIHEEGHNLGVNSNKLSYQGILSEGILLTRMSAKSAFSYLGLLNSKGQRPWTHLFPIHIFNT